MAEYIEREALLKSLCNVCDGWCENTACDCVNCKSEHRCDMVIEISEAPAADVVPVVHGYRDGDVCIYGFFIGRMIGAALVGKVSRKIILVVDGVGLTIFFLLVFFSRTELPIFIGIMGVGLFMATIYTSALALGTASIKGNDLGVSTMIFAGSTGGIITPAVVGMVAEKAGIQVGMGVVVAVTVLLLITILFSVFTKGGNEE